MCDSCESWLAPACECIRFGCDSGPRGAGWGALREGGKWRWRDLCCYGEVHLPAYRLSVFCSSFSLTFLCSSVTLFFFFIHDFEENQLKRETEWIDATAIFNKAGCHHFNLNVLCCQTTQFYVSVLSFATTAIWGQIKIEGQMAVKWWLGPLHQPHPLSSG